MIYSLKDLNLKNINIDNELAKGELSPLVDLSKLAEHKEDKEQLISISKSLLNYLIIIGETLNIKGYDYEINDDGSSVDEAFIKTYESFIKLIKNKSKIAYYESIYSLLSLLNKFNIKTSDLK